MSQSKEFDALTIDVFTGKANPTLAHEIARHLHVQLGRADVGRFSDGEVSVELMENVRERRVRLAGEHGNRQCIEFFTLRHGLKALNWLGWKDYSALRASPIRGRPSGVILPLLTHPLGPFTSTNRSNRKKLAGVEGFEPPYGGIKTRCLTAWRHPNSEINSERPLAGLSSQAADNLSNKGESFNPRTKNASNAGGSLRTISA